MVIRVERPKCFFEFLIVIAFNSRARREEKREYGEILREEEGDADYGEMVRPSPLDAAPYEKKC